MRIVFMGTPSAAVPSLRAVSAEHDVAAVYTRSDKPRGRGRRTRPSEVKATATDLGITEIVQPKTLRDAAEHERLATFSPDVVTVVAFGYILPPEILEIPRLGCVNVHFSLLPRWRGAAPVERAIMAGDTETGVTTMLMDPGLDTGPILHATTLPIRADETGGALTERLARIGADLLVKTLADLDAGTVTPRPQPEEGVTHADRISPQEAELDLSADAASLALRVRAFNPSPGTYTRYRGKRLKVWNASPVPGDGEPGHIAEVQEDGFDVQTGGGRLRLLEVQPEGKRVMDGADFVRGYRPQVSEEIGGA